MQRWQIEEWDAQRCAERAEDFVGIFDRAYAAQIEDAPGGGTDARSKLHEAFRNVLSAAGTRSGGQVLVAATGQRIDGFAAGWSFDLAQWWPQMVGPALDEAGLQEWYRDAFELVEIHVDPARQGRGIGTALLQHLAETCGTSTILLATSARADNRAPALYERVGFTELLPSFTYRDGTPARIMGTWTTTRPSSQA